MDVRLVELTNLFSGHATNKLTETIQKKYSVIQKERNFERKYVLL